MFQFDPFEEIGLAWTNSEGSQSSWNILMKSSKFYFFFWVKNLTKKYTVKLFYNFSRKTPLKFSDNFSFIFFSALQKEHNFVCLHNLL